MTLRLPLAWLGLMVAATAFAGEPAAAPPASSAAESLTKPNVTTGPTDNPRATQVICRDRLRPGSHIAMRTCATAEQWAARFPSTPVQPSNGPGIWGPVGVSTAGQSVGASAFTHSGSPYRF